MGKLKVFISKWEHSIQANNLNKEKKVLNLPTLDIVDDVNPCIKQVSLPIRVLTLKKHLAFLMLKPN